MKIKMLILILILFSCFSFSQEKIKIACIRNSATYGHLLPDNEKNCYSAQLNNLLDDKYEIQKLPDYPIIAGVAASFTGINNNMLIVGGGCNFSDKLATEGGVKKFYNDIYFLDITNSNKGWEKGTSLGYDIAYCSYVVTDDGVVCIGGQNEKGLLDKVTRVSFQEKNKNVKIEKLPNLPIEIFNAGATIINETIYLAGGLTPLGQNTDIFSLDLNNSKKGWTKIHTNQEDERQQPIVFTQDNKLFIAGGYDEKNAIVFTDIMQFDFSYNQWVKFTNILIDGRIGTFIGAGSANINSSNTLFVGGVNYDIFKSALDRIKKIHQAGIDGNIELENKLKNEGKEYMSQPDYWYKFSNVLLSFDTETKQWRSLGKFKQLGKAGAGISIHKNILYTICGELKPGKRTNEVFEIILK